MACDRRDILYLDNESFSVMGCRGGQKVGGCGKREPLVTGKYSVYHHHPAVWIFISSSLNG